MTTLIHEQYLEEIPQINEEIYDIRAQSPTQNYIISFANRQNILISPDSSFSQQTMTNKFDPYRNGDTPSNNHSLVSGSGAKT